HIDYITLQAVNPDKRRYIIENEAPRHYIDLDVYGAYKDSLKFLSWKQAIEKFTEDTLMAHGIVPWYISFLTGHLTDAFREKDAKRILKISADIGHYIGDAHVPLHTTRNYNGQLTNQHGIHSFWESRLPELFFEEYDFFVGKASYVANIDSIIWQAVYKTHNAVDSVLSIEKSLNDVWPSDKKYAFEERGNMMVKVYARAYSAEYHKRLSGQVERQMRAAVKLLGDIIFTCWVNAGSPSIEDQELQFEDTHEHDVDEIYDCNH
ncbi:MAG TPA: zinc dependent phospholipase C family protein, partial [Cytophagaceae bacterium]